MDDEIEFDSKAELRGRISKMDRWSYNKLLTDLARNVLFTRGNPESRIWVERFVTALSVINTKQLPIKDKINNKKDTLLKEINLEYDNKLEKHPNMKRFVKYSLERSLRQWYWEHLFEYALDLATEAGFTLGIDLIHEAEGIRS